ncbi:UDP-glucose dehydrogenase family protein [Paenibacillus wynnii]|uniref:UDP-glucose dehydrogenase family protein n=1 Tax=Paenibacillus wynnii TaxID=268407 RepID=UPI0027D7FC4B|nr:UDP-glucose/GDP-mannose dehydrogenase family protein [Paenibacillus wynnii]
MNITVIGAGYVGLVSGICFAEMGHQVIIVDQDEDKICTLQNGEIPIYEYGLKKLSQRNMMEGRLSFTGVLSEAVKAAEVVIIAVGTPQLPNGEADLSFVKYAAQEIGRSMNSYKVICVKSTVPVGTNDKVAGWIKACYSGSFDVASLPEFLREGSAIQDTLHPDRIVIGANREPAIELLTQLHAPIGAPLVITDIHSAEMIKYASNAFLATKISFINEIANICEKVQADVTEVARGMGLDKRIGSSFLKAGIGYGGSCFPKDTKALIQIAGNVEYDFKLLKAVVEVNNDQYSKIVEKLQQALGNLAGRTVGVWGLAFKPDTDDVRETPAFQILDALIKLGVKPKIFDPVAMNNFRRVYNPPSLTWCDSALHAAENCDAVCLLTEWMQFVEIDLELLKSVMSGVVLVDGRNAISAEKARSLGFSYYPVGRPALQSNINIPVNF